MKLIALREMATRSAAIWKILKKDGAVVVTRNGQPEGLFVSTSGETWIEDTQDIVFARAAKAAKEMRMPAANSGAAELTINDIAAEIKATRSRSKA